MTQIPPQQLSLNFDTTAVSDATPRLSAGTHREVGGNASSDVETAPKWDNSIEVISLCSFRKEQKQRRSRSLYAGILASISHIA